MVPTATNTTQDNTMTFTCSTLTLHRFVSITSPNISPRLGPTLSILLQFRNMHLRVFSSRSHLEDVNVWRFDLDNFVRTLPICSQLGRDFVSGIG